MNLFNIFFFLFFFNSLIFAKELPSTPALPQQNQEINVIDEGISPRNAPNLNSKRLKQLFITAQQKGFKLYFPDGIYTIQGQLPYFHQTLKSGPGKILHLDHPNRYYSITPKRDSENHLYFSPNGKFTHDGLSKNSPLPVQSIREILHQHGPLLQGVWIFHLSKGIYKLSNKPYIIRLGPDNERDALANSDEYSEQQLYNPNYIIFQGESVGYHPLKNSHPDPVVIFEGEGKAASGLDLRGGVRAYIKNIKFQNFNGSHSSNGVICTNGALRCENVHTFNCYYGISGMEQCLLEIKGGYIFGNSSQQYVGIRSMFGSKHDIGSQSLENLSAGPLIESCQTGALAQEFSTGHSDYVTFKNCKIGLRASVTSRFNANGSRFENCRVAIRSEGNSHVYYNTDTQIPLKGSKANLDGIQSVSGGIVISNRPSFKALTSYSISPRTIIYDTTTISTHQGIARYKFSLPSEYLYARSTPINLGKVLRIRVLGEQNPQKHNNATLKIKINNNSVTSFSLPKKQKGIFESCFDLSLNKSNLKIFSSLQFNNFSKRKVSNTLFPFSKSNTQIQIELSTPNNTGKIHLIEVFLLGS